MSGDHGDRAELPHGPGVTEDHPVEDPPPDVGEGDPEEGLQPGGPQHQGRLFFILPLGLHERDQFPRHEGEGDEDGGQDDPRHGEEDLDVMLRQPRSQPPLEPEDEHIDQTRDHRGDGEGEIDEGDEETLPRKTELGDGPGRHHPEQQVERHCHQGGQQGQADTRQGVGLVQRREVDRNPLIQGLRENRRQRHDEKQRQKHERHRGEEPPNPAGFGERAPG